MRKIILSFVLFLNIGFIIAQDNSWDWNLYGINNIYLTVNLCSEEYDYLEYEISRDVTLYLRNAGISISENKESDFLLSIDMLCSKISSKYIAINITFRLSEKVYIKRIKSFKSAILYDMEIIGHIPRGIEGNDWIKGSIIDTLKGFLLDYKLDNP